MKVSEATRLNYSHMCVTYIDKLIDSLFATTNPDPISAKFF